MRLTLLFVCLAALLAVVCGATANRSPAELLRRQRALQPEHPTIQRIRSAPFKTFAQTTDHFDPTNPDKFQQRYMELQPTSTRQPGDPIFIYLAGEAPMEFFDFQEVQCVEWAQKLNAVYYSLEHRFYGDSLPAPDYSTENLHLLSTQQALADAAAFIHAMNKTIEHPGPWVVFGCSYAGALSTFFRAKYPNVVLASVDASGPVEAQIDFSQYYGLFNKVAPAACTLAVQQAVQNVTAMLTTAAGREQLGTAFNSCKAIPSDPSDQYYFLLSLTEAIGGSDQFENPPDWPLKQTCGIMTNTSMSLVDRWATVFAIQNGGGPAEEDEEDEEGAPKCNDFDMQTGMIHPMQNVSSQDRSWFWQKCTEFGFFKPTDGSIFFDGRLDLATQVQWCSEIFNVPGMTPQAEWTNTYYGGNDVQVSNAFVTNGLIDPWHQLSLLDNRPGVEVSTYEAGHCASLTASTSEDPSSLVKTRAAVLNFLTEVLAKHKEQHAHAYQQQ